MALITWSEPWTEEAGEGLWGYGSVCGGSIEKVCSWPLKEGQNLDMWMNFYTGELSKPSFPQRAEHVPGQQDEGLAGPCKCWPHVAALEASGPPGQHWPFQTLSGNCFGNQESSPRPAGERLPLPMPYKQAHPPGLSPNQTTLVLIQAQRWQEKLERQRKRFDCFLRLTGPARWKAAREAAAGDSLPALDSRQLLQGTIGERQGWPLREHGPVEF